MKLQAYRDIFFALPHGGFINPDIMTSNELADSVIGMARAITLPAIFKNTRQKHPSWYQPYYAEYKKDLQIGAPVGCTIFEIPPVLGLGATEGGYGYMGIDNCNSQWRVCTNRSQFTSWINDRQMNPTSGRKVYILIEGTRYCEVYSLFPIKENPKFINVYADPLSIPTFNREEDEYPIDDGAGGAMLKQLIRDEGMVMAKSIIDRIHQGRADDQQPMPKSA